MLLVCGISSILLYVSLLLF